MGLFSFLKKHREPLAEPPAPDTRLRAGVPSRLQDEAERARQREIARATAAKIDAIELQMASDFFPDQPEWDGLPPVPAIPVLDDMLPDLEEELPDPAAKPASAPVVEESAILYANGQLDAAEQLLLAALPGLAAGERQPWWMLFDLYQAGAREHDFESIAIDYAGRFDTSPPAYSPLALPDAPERAYAGVAPAQAFAGVLDGEIAAQLQRLRQAAAPSPLVRLDFGAVRAATPDGCAALLAALQELRADGRALILGGAATLVAVLRPMLVIGARGASQAPWLLLLELLQQMNLEKEFEETAMDYCVTFEVSPPSFEALVTVATAAPASKVAGDRFLLPALVAGDCAQLAAAIADYAQRHDPVVLDCSRLARIDYPAASALQAQLRNLAADGRRIELRDLNHMAATLLRLLGCDAHARLFAHRY